MHSCLGYTYTVTAADCLGREECWSADWSSGLLTHALRSLFYRSARSTHSLESATDAYPCRFFVCWSMSLHIPNPLVSNRLNCTLAHKLYPVRIRVVNDVSKQVTWMTVAYTRKHPFPPFYQRNSSPCCRRCNRIVPTASCTAHAGRAQYPTRSLSRGNTSIAAMRAQPEWETMRSNNKHIGDRPPPAIRLPYLPPHEPETALK